MVVGCDQTFSAQDPIVIRDCDVCRPAIETNEQHSLFKTISTLSSYLGYLKIFYVGVKEREKRNEEETY